MKFVGFPSDIFAGFVLQSLFESCENDFVLKFISLVYLTVYPTAHLPVGLILIITFT